MRTRVIDAIDATPDDLRRWRALADRAVEPNAYLDPRWLHTSVLRHPDASALRLLLVEDDVDLRGVFAFSIEPAWRGMRVRAVSTAGRFLDMHAERHHPLVDPACTDQVVRALLTAMAAAGAGVAVLRKLPGDGPLAAALSRALVALDIPCEETLRRAAAYAPAGSVTPPAEQPDFTIPGASARTKKRFRQYARALERETGSTLRVRDRAAEDAAIDDFLRMQATGWKGDVDRGGLAMKQSSTTERWFADIVRAFGEDGDLSVVELSAEEATIWLGVSLCSGGVWSGFLDAYDERFRHHRPGNLGRVAELNYFAAAFPGCDVDPNLDPYYASSSALYPATRDRVDLVLAPGGTVARGLVRALPRVRAVRDRLRARLHRVR